MFSQVELCVCRGIKTFADRLRRKRNHKSLTLPENIQCLILNPPLMLTIMSSAIWIVPAAVKTRLPTSHLEFYMQHENAAASVICLAKILHSAVMRDIHSTFYTLEMDRSVKCHPVSCSLYTAVVLYTTVLSLKPKVPASQRRWHYRFLFGS